MKKTLLTTALGLGLVIGLTGCTDANVASFNLSKAADNFEIDRRIVFYNGITGEYILELQGRCSLGIYDRAEKLTVTCKTSETTYKKHFLGLSDNVTYFSEQVQSKGVNVYHYRTNFKPQAILPDIDFKGSTGALIDATTPDTKD